ncbi:hypothetical protein [Massilia genomosp. 1]|uniref:Uncharacterized protein n=1 Tax=Massilia genomosp. 1 TaxID=2609280 RepID=A0ABX0N4U4_9BURK|nr:hypothetical protein [Massilia genomosp. 1]NHZ66559.1 hypothetical protein [Massilia genomosp. 1]
MSNLSNFAKKLCAAGTLCIALTPAQAAGSDPPKDISKMLQGMSETITSVKLVVVNPVPTFPSRLTESEMHRIGCSFEAKRKDDIASLLDIIGRGQIIEMVPYFNGGRDGIGPRLGVYFYRDSAIVAKLIFNVLSPAERQEYGWFGDDVSIRAMNSSFAIDLRKWAEDHESLGTNYCDLFRKVAPN